MNPKNTVFAPASNLKSNSLQGKTLERKVSFAFLAPAARKVTVPGTFNQWNTQALALRKSADGWWRGELALRPGRYEYKILVDGRWENDQQASATVANSFGSANSILEVR